MTVTIINEPRKTVTIGWDVDEVDSDRVDIHTRNPATGDISERLDSKNDGEAELTYPVDFTGTSQVIVVPAGTEIPDFPEWGEIDPGDSGEVEL